MKETRNKKFERILKKILKSDEYLLQRLADDFETKATIVARDGCVFCGEREWPCPCINRDRNF